MLNADQKAARRAGQTAARKLVRKSEADSLKSWLVRQAESDEDFKAKVEERLNELRIKEELVKIRTARGLTQATMSRIARLSQPYLAKLESGDISNVELKTLTRLATALGLRLKVEFADENSSE